jgi:hypothetical protein
MDGEETMSATVRRHQSISLPPLFSPLLSHTLLFSPTFSPGPYVHSPTLCTITRCQTLKANDSWTSKTPTRILVDIYCRRPFPSPLRSYLRRFGHTADALGQVHVIQRHPLRSHGCLIMEAWYWEAWYCHFYYIICTLT